MLEGQGMVHTYLNPSPITTNSSTSTILTTLCSVRRASHSSYISIVLTYPYPSLCSANSLLSTILATLEGQKPPRTTPPPTPRARGGISKEQVLRNENMFSLEGHGIVQTYLNPSYISAISILYYNSHCVRRARFVLLFP